MEGDAPPTLAGSLMPERGELVRDEETLRRFSERVGVGAAGERPATLRRIRKKLEGKEGRRDERGGAGSACLAVS